LRHSGCDIDEFTNFCVDRIDIRFGESAARDAALICGDVEAEACISQASKCRRNAVEDADICGIASELVIRNEGAVAVEEDCGFQSLSGRRCGGS
jgi:hypothetical protein